MKLHLGCGYVHLDSYLNIDRIWQPGVDKIENIGILHHYHSGSIDEIYCCHALDHFSRWEYPVVLKRWFALLKPGGTLRLSMPDFAWAVAHVIATGRVDDIIGHLYAAQDYPDNVRHFSWNLRMAENDLKAAGFSIVERYDAEAFLAPLKAFDCSLLGDATGRPRSLNVIATKAL